MTSRVGQLRRSFRSVPGLGLVVVEPPSKALEALLNDKNVCAPREYVNAIISQTLVSPRRLSYAEVDALPASDRALLRDACAEAAGLGWSRLPQIRAVSSDNAFVELMTSSRRDAHSSGSTGPVGMVRSLGNALSGFGVQVNDNLRGEDPLVVVKPVVERWSAWAEEQRREAEALHAHPLFFVVGDLPYREVRLLLQHYPESIEDLVAEYVAGDLDLLQEVEEAVEGAPILDDPQRADLRRGLQELSTDSAHAARHLVAGVEGALWLTAEAEGVTDSRRHMLRTSRSTPPYAPSLTWLFREDGGLQLGAEFTRFLERAVFTRATHDVRHGRARSGHETVAVMSFLALLGWLDRYADTRFEQEMSHRLTLALEVVADAA